MLFRSLDEVRELVGRPRGRNASARSTSSSWVSKGMLTCQRVKPVMWLSIAWYALCVRLADARGLHPDRRAPRPPAGHRREPLARRARARPHPAGDRRAPRRTDDVPGARPSSTPRGTLATSKLRRQTVRFFVAKINADLAFLASLLEAGTIRSVIDRTYALDRLPEALAYHGERHARGKIVVTA
jgi:zinc-binding alcohol dehydrogenase family protein